MIEHLDRHQTPNHQTIHLPDTMKRDRFELLSAYLDCEATADERRQVEGWLSQDPVVQRLYERLLRLRRGVQHLPVPAGQACDQQIRSIFAKITFRRLILAGGMAMAALGVSLVSGVRLNHPQWAAGSASHLQTVTAPQPQKTLAKTNANAVHSTSDLMIALNEPIIEIPKAPISIPTSSLGAERQPSIQ